LSLKKRTPQQPAKRLGTLRIIGGQWRGRRLSFPDTDGLRPTGDRIRETLFNWLQADIPGANCLDLFSGSGALGLEALSRGAQTALLIEKNAMAASQIKTHLSSLPDHQGKIKHHDALDFLSDPTGERFDIVFIDPPFQAQLWDQVFQQLESHWLNEGAAIYIEAPKRQTLSVPTNWLLHRQKQSGQVNYAVYYRQ
jgi:16S rRNA (guanine966-N2)-methyltransferase